MAAQVEPPHVAVYVMRPAHSTDRVPPIALARRAYDCPARATTAALESSEDARGRASAPVPTARFARDERAGRHAVVVDPGRLWYLREPGRAISRDVDRAGYRGSDVSGGTG